MPHSSDFQPWEKYPDVTSERLSIIATIIRDVRDDAALLHDPESGDKAWGFGCRAYERICFAIEKAAQKYEWLKIIKDPEKPLRFTFAIGSIPFRFYSGGPEDPPSRYLATTYEEIHQRQIALDLGMPLPKDGILRIAVETDATGRAFRISVVEMDEQRNVTDVYSVPMAAKAVPMRSKPVDTPAPKFTRRKRVTETEKRQERNASGQ